MKLLIVDDEKDIAEYLRLILEDNFACECKTAFDGQAALDLSLQETYDFILTDYFMPKLTGADFIRHLRQQDNPNRTTPVLLLSGFIDKAVMQDLAPLGVTFMSKPMFEEELVKTVKLALDK